MAVTFKEFEAAPASYPPAPEGLSEAAAALDAATVWARIESYCRTRWTPREVIWTVDGAGYWEAPLEPATVMAFEIWDAGAWADYTPAASPWGGYDLPGVGPWRVAADVGAGDVPPIVNEAFRRLAEYMATPEQAAGASAYSVNIQGAIDMNRTRSPAWLAKALQYSGAGDLLRGFRRLK